MDQDLYNWMIFGFDVFNTLLFWLAVFTVICCVNRQIWAVVNIFKK